MEFGTKFYCLVIIFMALCSKIMGAELQCDFFENSFKPEAFASDGYRCETSSVFDKDAEVKRFSETHQQGYKDTDVKCFKIPKNSDTRFVPIKMCSHFPKLLDIVIHGRNIIEISRGVFAVCVNVFHVVISGTMIQWLSENTFYDLPALRALDLSNNQLRILQMNLVLHNVNLSSFVADNNELEQIDIQFRKEVVEVSLRRNKCINEFANDSSAVKSLNEKIFTQCASSTNTKFCKKQRFKRDTDLCGKSQLHIRYD